MGLARRLASPRVRLALALVAALALSAPAHGQGLREDALQLLDAASQGLGDPCAHLSALDELLETVEAAEAEPFMADELAELRAARPELATRCQAWQTAVADCERLGQARAFCALLRECQEVRGANARMQAFWESAQRGCGP